MDLRKGSKRIKSIYKGENYIPGLMVNGRLWHGSPGDVRLVTSNSSYSGDIYFNIGKVAYNYTIPKMWAKPRVNFYTIHISAGGRMIDTTLDGGGRMFVFSGGSAANTAINQGGNMIISSGGIATNVTVSSGGFMYVNSGGTATNVTSQTGANIVVSSGGYITYA